MEIGGIAGNLIAALIIFVAGLYWSKVIRPWWDERIYQGVRIDGSRWQSETVANGQKRVGLWEITQRAHRVEGKISMIEGPTKGTVYGFKGEFKNNLLSGTFFRLSKTEIGRGTVVLQLQENGNRLEGYTVFYNPQTEKVDYSRNTLLRRDPSIV